MKSFLVIGAGTFGHHLCREFASLKCEVMLVDTSEEPMNDLLPIVAAARIADCSNPETLKTFDVPSFDACFVCIGRSFQYSLQITSLLKELGAKKVYSKADEDIQAKFLLRNGADAVIYPEHDAAQRIAVSESSDAIFDCIPMSKDYGIYEIEPNSSWIGKSILRLDFRKAYNLSVLAIKNGEDVRPNPPADYVFNKEEHVLVLGRESDIRKVIER